MKQCYACKCVKPAHEFNVRSASRADGLQAHCRTCERVIKLQYSYGLTVAQYDAMLAAQDGGCAICGRECSTGRRLAVDHAHDSGKVRGLLCQGCNTSLGKMDERPEWMRNAADYLDANTFDVLT